MTDELILTQEEMFISTVLLDKIEDFYECVCVGSGGAALMCPHCYASVLTGFITKELKEMRAEAS